MDGSALLFISHTHRVFSVLASADYEESTFLRRFGQGARRELGLYFALRRESPRFLEIAFSFRSFSASTNIHSLKPMLTRAFAHCQGGVPVSSRSSARVWPRW